MTAPLASTIVKLKLPDTNGSYVDLQTSMKPVCVIRLTSFVYVTMVTPAPIVTSTVPAAVLTLLPRPSETVMPETCVPAVASSATLTTVPSLYLVTGPQIGAATVPAATLNGGLPFSV